jgi:hypothetical protein
MSGYHSFELAYLAQTYEPAHYETADRVVLPPRAGGIQESVLRVSPDILPPGRVCLDAVWINGDPYSNFDANALTVKLPETKDGTEVRFGSPRSPERACMSLSGPPPGFCPVGPARSA